ncbi:DUF3048 domain-containing protein [Tessaracoccus terricola]
MQEITRRHALGGVLAAAAVGVSACAPSVAAESASPSPSPSPSPTPTPTPSPTPTVDDRPRWPLTGMLMTDPTAGAHPAVAVKVPDNKNEHPQEGINEADIVFVQADGYRNPNGYDGTRLMPVFHSVMAANAAPVRSLRPVDVPLLAPMHAVLGSSGGARWVVNYLESFSEVISSDLVYIDMKGTGAYSVNQDRIRKYEGQTYYDRALVCHPGKLAEVSGVFPDGPPVPYLPFATDVDEPSINKGDPAARVEVPHQGDDYRMAYDFDEATGTWLRSMPWGEHVLLDGSRVTTDNILVIRAELYRDKIHAGSGGAEPIYEVIDGTDTFLYASGGRYVTGTWTKGSEAEPFRFTLDDGSPLLMTPGRTFVELVDTETQVTIA